jgi:hypothetical protein
MALRTRERLLESRRYISKLAKGYKTGIYTIETLNKNLEETQSAVDMVRMLTTSSGNWLPYRLSDTLHPSWDIPVCLAHPRIATSGRESLSARANDP